MKKKKIGSRLDELEAKLIGSRPPWMQPCPDCGLWPGRTVTVDEILGFGDADDLGCETCVRLRAELPRTAGITTIEICRDSGYREELE